VVFILNFMFCCLILIFYMFFRWVKFKLFARKLDWKYRVFCNYKK
jgi:hypothetical protein